MFTRLITAASRERPIAALRFLLYKISDQIRGRALAAMMGWKKSYVGAGAKIYGSRSIRIGVGAYIHRHAWIEAVGSFAGDTFQPSIVIGKGFSASDQLHISAINRIDIGDNCLFGRGVYVGDHNHGSYQGDRQSRPEEPPVVRKLVSHGPVVIGSNVWLGDNVVVMGAVIIGDGAVVGANSMVVKDIPPRTLAAGAPAKVLKCFDESSGKWERFEE
ncbi:acyltransferase [Rhodoferax sp. GW822-FHT02A01]|uniref:acyltransferase n=1 Tax=Rhodoferax sp. GW822-FHT02A01 TaxID=3141537 RepID=UPI00315D7106